jgi:hypothetical protein
MSVGDKWTRAEFTIYNRLKKAADAQYARMKEEKQTAFTSKEGNIILDKVEEEDSELACMLFCQGLGGPRHDDTNRLQKRDLCITELKDTVDRQYEVAFTLRRGKNMKTCKDKRNCRERTDRCLLKMPESFHQFAAHYSQHRVGKGSQETVFNTSTAKANRIMRKLGCSGTTYGFRKHYAAKTLWR